MEDREERKVYVYAHNTRGFDTSFLLTVLHRMGYKVEKVLRQSEIFVV